jgi:Bacterial Ig-like domain
MPRDLYGSWPVLAVLACVMGCAGNGEGLDASGQPILPDSGNGGSSGPVTADFQSIQDNVFTPICSKCHIGASAPEGLQLDAAHSYNLLVGVPSVEQPSLLRVDPGNPDQSYMVLKIEGAPGIEGGQMPLGETPLPQDTINAIRQWISNGAPRDESSAAAAVSTAPFEIETTAPLDASVRLSPLRQIVVTFSQELDASYITDAGVTLQRLDGPVPLTVPVHVAPAAHNASVMLITPFVPLGEGTYRATVHGTGDAALADLKSRLLGADHSFEFSVEGAP